MPNTEDIIKLRELVPVESIAMLATSTPTRELHARPLVVQEIDDRGAIWFIASIDDDWVVGLAPDEHVNVSVADPHSRTWVSIAGTARLVVDELRLNRLWNDDRDDLGQGSPDDTTRLIEVRPTMAQYWDLPKGRIRRLIGAATRLIGRDDTTGTITLG